MYYLKKNSNLNIANVFIHNFASDESDSKYGMIHKGKWDAAFSALDIDCIGFDFEGSPFGDDEFDFLLERSYNLKYKDVFTGFVYLRLDKCKYIWGNPGIISDDFLPEITRRIILAGESVQVDSINNWYNIFYEETYLNYYKKYEMKIKRYLK